jgi:hypothetical protein
LPWGKDEKINQRFILYYISIEFELKDLLFADGCPISVPIIKLELRYVAISINDLENILLIRCLVNEATYHQVIGIKYFYR